MMRALDCVLFVSVLAVAAAMLAVYVLVALVWALLGELVDAAAAGRALRARGGRS